ncbi:hypothetical protein GCM10029992_37190 [Glycomyces albus]
MDFSPDCRRLAAASFDGSVLIWDLDNPRQPEPYAELSGSDAGQRAVDFDSTGSIVTAAGEDPAARIWLTDPEAAASAICEAAGEPITLNEWERYVPDTDYQPPC